MPRRRIEPTGRLYIANESFVINIDGADQMFHQGRTRVREGHPVLDRAPHLFDELVADLEIEEATSRPGELRQ